MIWAQESSQVLPRAITLSELFEMVPVDATAEQMLKKARLRKDGAECPRCNSQARVKETPSRRPVAYCCGECRRHFNVRTSTVLDRTSISYQHWVIAMCLIANNPKGVSSMKLPRGLGITYKSGGLFLIGSEKLWQSIQRDFSAQLM